MTSQEAPLIPCGLKRISEPLVLPVADILESKIGTSIVSCPFSADISSPEEEADTLAENYSGCCYRHCGDLNAEDSAA